MFYEEEKLQYQIVAYLKMKGVLYTGGFDAGRLNIRQAVRRKNCGYVAGTPDLIILEPCGKFHGLFIEVKSKKGVLSKNQKVFHAELEKRKYKVLVIRDFDKAVIEIEKYLKEAK